MSKIKIAEIFYSLQGEGLYLGTPSIFLRVFGCNFKCASFGMPRGQVSTEAVNLNPDDYKTYDELPLVHTGCDSYASWDPRFKHLSPMMSITDIVDKIESLLPKKKFDENTHLIITGGEPLLGWQKMYIPLLEEIENRKMNLSHVTFETNGTQKIMPELQSYLGWRIKETLFSISSKLPSSGEKWEYAIKPDVVQEYLYTDSSKAYFKWVVSNQDDYEDVQRAVQQYGDYLNQDMIPVYLMPAGGTTLHYNNNEKWVAELAMKNGWRYTPRLQVQLWKNAWGT